MKGRVIGNNRRVLSPKGIPSELRKEFKRMFVRGSGYVTEVYPEYPF
jgi:hypothetical protein